ncbi:MAG TPA: hypothetical protein VMU54_24750 [Planctomycetota bacterium]|nr:hypothetical protein [Planctomycetota bacterium]
MRTSVLAVILSLAARSAAAQSSDVPGSTDLTVQEQIQKRVQSETDQTVLRVNAMIRLLSFHNLDQAEEAHLLREVSGTLSGLSKEQMSKVIVKLNAAAAEGDEKKARAEMEEAYRHHRDILDHLNFLLARYDAVHGLEQAAERMEILSRDELEIYLRQALLCREGRQGLVRLRDLEGKSAVEQDEEKRKKLVQWGIDQEKALQGHLTDRADRLADDQTDMRRQIAELFEQLAELRPELPADHQERLARAAAFFKSLPLVDEFETSAANLHAHVQSDLLVASWEVAGPLQWKAARELRDLARALRTPLEDLDRLREARQRLDHTIGLQSDLIEESALPEPREWPQVERRSRDFGDRELKLEFEAYDLEGFLNAIAASVSAKIEPAEPVMREAQEALRVRAKPRAAETQRRAVTILKDALQELDRLIKEAERAKEDKLDALRRLSESIDQLIREQKETKEKTEAAKKDELQLQKLAPEEARLEEKTKELTKEPLPTKATGEALDTAAREMAKAKEALETKKAPDALAGQEKAIAALEEAKKAVDQAIAKAEAEENNRLLEAALDVAKAIEQTELAKADSEQAARQPDLAQLQKELARAAEKQNLEGAKNADQAAQALASGDLKHAIEEQTQALSRLEAEAKKPEAGKKEPSDPKAPPEKSKDQPSPAELAEKQAELLSATRALQQAESENQAAEAATSQAQALAPEAVQPQLDQAQQALGTADHSLHEGKPAPAAHHEGQALKALKGALETLNKQLAEAGLPEVQPGQPVDAQATGDPGAHAEPGLGQHPGIHPGQGWHPGQGKGPRGKGMDSNLSQGKGDRMPDGSQKNAASSLSDAHGTDSFSYLPQRQRDLIRQALSEGLPPEYAAQIQQYYVNLARGRAATTAADSEKKK